jgi:hypothetical protein
MEQNITNTSVSEYEEFQMEEIVLDFILVTTYFILGSVGNIAIIWLYSKMNQRRTKAYKEIIVFLAIVDLISCILNSFLNIALLIGPRFLENSYFCKFLRFSCHVTTVYSAFILLVIALQRYLLICRPFNQQMTSCVRKISIIFCAVLSTAFCSPVFVFYGTGSDNQFAVSSSCGILGRYIETRELFVYNIIYITVITIVIGSISYLYFCVLRTAYVKRKIVGKNHHNVNHADRSDASGDNTINTNISMLSLNNTLYGSKSSLSSTRTHINCNVQRQHILTLMFLTITILCIVAFIPRRVIELEEALDKQFPTNTFGRHEFLLRFLKTLYMLGNVINPYIYGLFDRDLRKMLRKLCKR